MEKFIVNDNITINTSNAYVNIRGGNEIVLDCPLTELGGTIVLVNNAPNTVTVMPNDIELLTGETIVLQVEYRSGSLVYVDTFSQLESVTTQMEQIAKLNRTDGKINARLGVVGVDQKNTGTHTPKRGTGFKFTTGSEFLQFPFFVTNRVQKATISSNKLISADSGATTTAAYTGIDLGNISKYPKKMKAKAIFSSGNTGGTIGLICGKLGLNGAANITKKSLHIVFTDVKVTFGLYENEVQLSVENHNYETPCNRDNATEYEFSWEISGNTITFTYPSGTYQITNENISNYYGRYCTLEHFWGGAAITRPQFTYFEIVDNDNIVYLDHFSRADGAVGKMETGQKYIQAEGSLANVNVTYYDVVAGQDVTVALSALAQLNLAAGKIVQNIRINGNVWLCEDLTGTANTNANLQSITKPPMQLVINNATLVNAFVSDDRCLPISGSWNKQGGRVALGTEYLDTQLTTLYKAGCLIPCDVENPSLCMAWDSSGNQLASTYSGGAKQSNQSTTPSIKIKLPITPEMVQTTTKANALTTFFDNTSASALVQKEVYLAGLSRNIGDTIFMNTDFSEIGLYSDTLTSEELNKAKYYYGLI